MTTIIVDTNIVFSALVNKNSKIATFLLEPDMALVMPKYGFVELFKHKEKICALSKHSQDEIIEILYELMRHIDFFDEHNVSASSLKRAWELVKYIDPKDLLFVALTLELGGLLWAGDTKLGTGLRNKGFDSFYLPEK